MSFDLTARSDESLSKSVPFGEAARIVAMVLGETPDESTGYTLEQGDDVLMQISLESEEFDYDDPGPPAEIDRIEFNIPYGYIGGLDRCVAVALRIANGLDWELYDPQRDEVF